jgi:hypothetical protein
MMNALPVKKTTRGFALLYIMLVLASVVTVAALIAGHTGMFAGNRIRLGNGSSEVRMVAMYCGEQLLMQVRNNTNLSGSGTLTYEGGSCIYTVSGSVPNKVIDIVASKNNFYRHIIIMVSQVSPALNASWVETS